MALEHLAYTRLWQPCDEQCIVMLTSILPQVGGREGCGEATRVSGRGAAFSADLGSSSKYSSENLEGRSGEGFHVNSS